MRLVEDQAPTSDVIASGHGGPLAYRRTVDAEIGASLPFYRQGQDTTWAERPTAKQVVKALPGRNAGLRVAIVHEWLDTYAGSERVLEQLLHCFPSADIFAVADFMAEGDRDFLQGRKVQTSFVQRLPFARRCFRNYLGLMPIAIQQLDVTSYDLVISSNHAVAKGVITGPDQIHISYMHSPMRYVWDLQHQYLSQMGMDHGLKGMYARWLFARLRQWDVATSHQVDHFIANSSYIARRVRRTYRREALVIHPPVDVDRFSPMGGKEDFFLLACRFVPYKRAEIVVESFAQQPDRRLIVVGDGPDAGRVRAAARGAPNIEFAGTVEQKDLISLMQRARAFVFAAEEDFGITLVEAQACGTPVIAYGHGGATDIVQPDETEWRTGLLFDRQDADAITEAVDRFETLESQMTTAACRMNALRFSEARFRTEIGEFVDQVFS
jgi:glycosyltransferase involved in cell wall biosynthesis